MELIEINYKIRPETAMKLHEIQEAIDPEGEDDDELFQFLIDSAEKFAERISDDISTSVPQRVKTEEKHKTRADEEILDEFFRQDHPS